MTDQDPPSEAPTPETNPPEGAPAEAASPEPASSASEPHEAGAPESTEASNDRAERPVVRDRDDRPRIIARYGLLGFVGEFTCSKKITFEPGSKLVLQTERGIEIGEHVPLTSTHLPGQCIEPETIRRYVEQSGPEYLQRRGGRVLRVASEQDLSEERHINTGAVEELAFCQDLLEKHQLPMKLITCEHLFGGERVIFYFMSDGRVDFRQLVRDLAREYQTRIEMRQVGARDEARLVADFEICGRECCCKNFLKTLRPVSMKMAKMQKATLDPSKVSGRCGRLRCCLRYEHEVYEDLYKRLPRSNTWVRTAEGEGRVVDRQTITQLVTVALEDERRVTFPFEEIEVLADKPPERPAKPPESARERADRGSQPRDAAETRDQPRRPRRRRRRQPLTEGSDRPAEPDAQPASAQKDQEVVRDADSIAASDAGADAADAVSQDPEAAGAETAADRPKPQPSASEQGKADAAQPDGKPRSRRRRRRRRPRKGGGENRDASNQQPNSR